MLNKMDLRKLWALLLTGMLMGTVLGTPLPPAKIIPFARDFQAVLPAEKLDLRDAVIVPPAGDAGMEIARKVQKILQDAWKIAFDIQEISSAREGSGALILCGSGMDNNPMRELAANLQILRTAQGSELRVFPQMMDWNRGVVYCGGRTESEILQAAAKLVKLFPDPGNLTYHGSEDRQQTFPAPEELEKTVREFFASRNARKINLTLDKHMKDAFFAFRATGNRAYVKAFCTMLQILESQYQESLQYSNHAPPTFEFHQFPQYLYTLEHAGVFTQEDRFWAAELCRKVLEGTMGYWEMKTSIELYRTETLQYQTNHYCFAARTVENIARYLACRTDAAGMDYFRAVAAHVFEGVRPYPLSPEDAAGYQYLVYRIFTDYMLSTGKAEEGLFRSEAFQYFSDYAKMSFNHLGYTAGYGDANLLGMRGAFVPLFEVYEMTRDPEALAILSLIRRTLEEKSGFYWDKVREWNIPEDLPAPADPRFLGLRTFCVDERRQQVIGLSSGRYPALDKAIYRSSWQPDGEFLAVNGLNGSAHGHDDAMGISQYLLGKHLWIFEGDYIRRFAEDHNLTAVVKDGYAPERRRNRIPKTERFSQLVGSQQLPDRKMAAFTMLLENNNGVDYFRHICKEAGGGLWVIDEMVARTPGQYRFLSRWHTTGAVSRTPQGVLVTQKAVPGIAKDRNRFIMAEGTGASAVTYSRHLRSHGRSNAPGVLEGYRYSDGMIRTQLFFKDAKLEEGGRAILAFYFKDLAPGEKPVEVRRIGENVFAVPGRIAVLNGTGGAFFAAPCGSVQTGEVAQDKLAAWKKAASSAPVEKVRRAPEYTHLSVAKFSAPVTAMGSGRKNLGIGLKNGEFLLVDSTGKTLARTKLPGEISVVAPVETDGKEFWAVGCRATQYAAESDGSLHWIDSAGKECWKTAIPYYLRRPGVPKTIFPARLDGADQPLSLIVGAESWRYFAFDLQGKERWIAALGAHGATAGAAGDLDGDGKDEIFAGIEYYYHRILDPAGKVIKTNTTSPWDLAAVIGDAGDGAKRIYAARMDGFLYGETFVKGIKTWMSNIGGAAVGIELTPSGVITANQNGFLVVTGANGRRKRLVSVSAPAAAMMKLGDRICVACMDGRIMAVDPATGKRELAGTYAFQENGVEPPVMGRIGDRGYIASGNQLFQLRK